MKRSQALPGQFLAKEDFDDPVLATVNRVQLEEIKGNNGDMEQKPVLYLDGPSDPGLDCTRGIILNGVNWDACEEISGEPDSDNWVRTQIVVFHDENVMFGARKTGGIRIRRPRTDPAPVEEPPPPPSKPTAASVADDVPF
jgi:hypothetical protein